mmetsp:Transcript_35379/g.140559  ORF Transcript_35379/g.140559 Transcript_35379/m.140559 type:complete len:632 (-) Transcript_35379:1345-3240(-)
MDTEEAAPAAASSTPLTLSVKMLDSTAHTVVISQENPQVSDLRREVASVAEVPVERQRLIFRGAVLRDDKSLADYHLENGHVLHLVVKPEVPMTSSPGAPPGAPQPRRRHHHHHHHHPQNPQGQRQGRPANPIMLRVTGVPRGDNLTFQTRAMGIPRGGNLTFENIRSIVTSVLQALQLPVCAAQRGGASAAAAAMTASVHANRRQSGRAHIAQTTLADINKALDRLGSPQIPTDQLPEDSVEALQFLVDAAANVQRALIERNEALRGSLPSGVENVANDRPAAQRLASAASDFALSANISNGLTGLAAAIVGTSQAERRAAQDQQTSVAENSPDQDSQRAANEPQPGAAEEQTQSAQQGGVQFQTGFTYESNGAQDASSVVDMDGNQGGATGNQDERDQPVPGETTDQQRTPGDAANAQQAQARTGNEQQGTSSQASQQQTPPQVYVRMPPQVHVQMEEGSNIPEWIPNILPRQMAPVIQGMLQSLERQRQQAAHQPDSETRAGTNGGNVVSYRLPDFGYSIMSSGNSYTCGFFCRTGFRRQVPRERSQASNRRTKRGDGTAKRYSRPRAHPAQPATAKRSNAPFSGPFPRAGTTRSAKQLGPWTGWHGRRTFALRAGVGTSGSRRTSVR